MVAGQTCGTGYLVSIRKLPVLSAVSGWRLSICLAAITKTNGSRKAIPISNIKKGANEMNSSGIRKKVLACMILFLTISFPFMAAWADDQPAPAAPAAPTGPSATFSTDILSQYIFRGAALSKDSAVIQPSATVTWNGFSANIWGNFDTSRHSNNPFLPLPAGQAGPDRNGVRPTSPFHIPRKYARIFR